MKNKILKFLKEWECIISNEIFVKKNSCKEFWNIIDQLLNKNIIYKHKNDPYTTTYFLTKKGEKYIKSKEVN